MGQRARLVKVYWKKYFEFFLVFSNYYDGDPVFRETKLILRNSGNYGPLTDRKFGFR